MNAINHCKMQLKNNAWGLVMNDNLNKQSNILMTYKSIESGKNNETN